RCYGGSIPFQGCALNGGQYDSHHRAAITPGHMILEERMDAGIDDGLVRLLVGLENHQDIISDINDALDLLPQDVIGTL
ncbi:MAG: PLP-dependent transferase, partial [Candidatus Adiutricales bacterium]